MPRPGADPPADPPRDEVDVAVIGGGVVGCAIAVALARAGKSVLVLEAGARLGTGITSRNSGVIHSGLYYPPGSLKATSCVRGNRLLYQWAKAHGVWHNKVGKLVVAQQLSQIPDLEALLANARDNQAPGVQGLTGAQASAREPAITSCAAIWCPETGIVDQHELVLSLQAAAQAAGATFVLNAPVTGIDSSRSGHQLQTARGEIRAERVVNAAGLAADQIAHLAGFDGLPIHPCRGDYYRLHSPVRYQHLIYPIKDRSHPGLGIHLTLERGGGQRLGPDATYVDRRDDFSDPPPEKHAVFLAAAQRLLGPVRPDQLSYDGCGIRPKLRAPSDPDEKDFALVESPPGILHLLGIESPGLTAALDLADRAAVMLG